MVLKSCARHGGVVHDWSVPNVPTAIRRFTNVLPLFITLQCLDVLTTLVFLRRGVAEGNPLMGWAFSHAHAPWMSLVVAKLAAVLIAHYCYRYGRMRLLWRANIGYSLVVAWNLVTIAITSVG